MMSGLVPLRRRTLGPSLSCTVMGFGSGGFSRAGLGNGRAHAAGVVRDAIEMGIDLVDTAEVYGTEAAVADGIEQSDAGPADVTVCTKILPITRDGRMSAEEFRASALERLRVLRRDHVDLLQVHSIRPSDYTWARDTYVPVLEDLRGEGRVGSIGITEIFQLDPGHEMLVQAVADRCWDTVMVGHNLVNPTARERVIGPAAREGIGVLVMFAVRDALVNVERLRTYLADNVDSLPADALDRIDVLTAAAATTGSGSLTDLAYRFAVSTPGVSTVLVGTGNPAHLLANRRAFEREPLPEGILAELTELFADIDRLSAQAGAKPPL